MLKPAVVLRHVAFEDLGTFAPVLTAAGYHVQSYDVGVDELWTLDPLKPALLIVLGGPVGVGDAEAYPVLTEEMALLRTRLAAGAPTLGICLGAQLMAAALRARVAATGQKEIGFSALTLTDAGRYGPLRHLDGVPVLHWHGDMFAIPDGAVRLAATPLCANQGFAVGKNILGLQFHPEADPQTLERWLIGHAAELTAAGIDPRDLREQAGWRGAALRQAGQAMLTEWLEGLDP